MDKWKVSEITAALLLIACFLATMVCILKGRTSSAVFFLCLMLALAVADIWHSLRYVKVMTDKNLKERKDLQAAKQELQQSISNEREQLRASVSHSLRMPLSIISGYSDLLRHNIIKDENSKKEYIQKIDNNIRYIENAVGNLLFEINPDKALQTFQFKEIDIIACLKNIIRDISDLAVNSNIMVRLIKSQDSIIINGDITQLKKLFYNLFENSFKYMKRPGVINITVSKIDESELLIVYKDDGEGMEANEVEHIFDANYQGSNQVSGSGMGMYFVKSIIDAHKGSIEAKSEKDKGMGIYIKFPSAPSLDAHKIRE